jgi:hypothetical protein
VIARHAPMGEAARAAGARFSTDQHADAVERLIAPAANGTVAA